MEVILPGDHVVVRIHANTAFFPEEDEKQQAAQINFWRDILVGCKLSVLVTNTDDLGVVAVYRPDPHKTSPAASPMHDAIFGWSR